MNGLPPAAEAAPRGERTFPPLYRFAQVTAVVLLVLGLAAVAWTVRGVLLMVLIGFLLASGLEPLVRGLERRGMRRGLAVLVLVLTLILVGGLFAWLAVRPAIEQAGEFVADIPNLLDQVADRFGGSSLAELLASDEFHQQIRSALDSVTQFAEVSVSVVFGALASVLGVAFTTFTIAAVTVYLMLALPSLKSFAGRALGDEERVGVMAEALRRVGGYVTGQLGICACAGITSSIVFLILGVPYAALLGLIVAILDAVPQIGATLGAIVAVAVALTQGVGTAVAVTVFFIIYQQLENFLIAPKVFSSAVALRPFTVFLAILMGGALAGVIGVVMALPIAAALKVVFRHVFREQLSAIEGRAVPDLRAPS